MLCYVAPASNPLVSIELFVSPPSVPIIVTAAPAAAGHVIVEVQIYLLAIELCCNFIIDLVKPLAIWTLERASQNYHTSNLVVVELN